MLCISGLTYREYFVISTEGRELNVYSMQKVINYPHVYIDISPVNRENLRPSK